MGAGHQHAIITDATPLFDWNRPAHGEPTAYRLQVVKVNDSLDNGPFALDQTLAGTPPPDQFQTTQALANAVHKWRVLAPDVLNPTTTSEVRSFTMDAPINVTTTADSNSCATPCSLRGAIAAANSGDTITIPTGTYTLTLGSELTISKSMTVSGAGSGDIIIQAATRDSATHRVFGITGRDVTIKSVTIRYGKTSGRGGGIKNVAALTLTDLTVTLNTSTGDGGGISNDRSRGLTITNSTISSNAASDSGGGGIYNRNSSVTVTNST